MGTGVGRGVGTGEGVGVGGTCVGVGAIATGGWVGMGVGDGVGGGVVGFGVGATTVPGVGMISTGGVDRVAVGVGARVGTGVGVGEGRLAAGGVGATVPVPPGFFSKAQLGQYCAGSCLKPHGWTGKTCANAVGITARRRRLRPPRILRVSADMADNRRISSRRKCQGTHEITNARGRRVASGSGHEES